MNQIDIIDDDIVFYTYAPSLNILLLYSGYITTTLITEKASIESAVILIFSSLVVTIIFVKKIVNSLSKRNDLRVGLEAERAIGDEVNRITSLGCRAFHDFPGEGFNIDHILLSKTGVYAIETKGRAKHTELDENWKVKYENNRLIFPHTEESEPLNQSQRQARWLSMFLSKKLRRKIPVKAVLAIPGWYTDIKQRPQNIIITNGRNLAFLAKGNTVLNKDDIDLVSNIIEERCRNVESFSYKPIIGTTMVFS